MAALATHIAAQLTAVLAHPHTRAFLYMFTGGAALVGLHYELKATYSRTIDQPIPAPATDTAFFEDGKQTFDDEIELHTNAPMAPNVPVPSIWGYPDTVSYTPGQPWNQALTLYVDNGHKQTNPISAVLSFLILLLILLYFLVWRAGKCYNTRKSRTTATAATNTSSSPVLTCNPTPPHSRIHTTPIPASTFKLPSQWYEIVVESGEPTTPTPPQQVSARGHSLVLRSKELAALSQRNKQLETRDRILADAARDALEKKEKAEKESAEREDRICELEAQLRDAGSGPNVQIKSLESALEEEKLRNVALKGENDVQRRQNKTAQEYEATIRELQEALAQAQNRATVAEDFTDQLERQNNEEVSRVNKETSATKQQLEVAKDRITSLESESAELRKQLKSANTQNMDGIFNLYSANVASDRLKQELLETKQRLSDYESGRRPSVNHGQPDKSKATSVAAGGERPTGQNNTRVLEEQPIEQATAAAQETDRQQKLEAEQQRTAKSELSQNFDPEKKDQIDHEIKKEAKDIVEKTGSASAKDEHMSKRSSNTKTSKTAHGSRRMLIPKSLKDRAAAIGYTSTSAGQDRVTFATTPTDLNAQRTGWSLPSPRLPDPSQGTRGPEESRQAPTSLDLHTPQKQQNFPPTIDTSVSKPSPIPTGPAEKHTCQMCGASFKDIVSKFTFAQNHYPICVKWKDTWEPRFYLKVKANGRRADIKTPPGWDHELTQRPEIDPDWLMIARVARDEHIKQLMQSSATADGLLTQEMAQEVAEECIKPVGEGKTTSEATSAEKEAQAKPGSDLEKNQEPKRSPPTPINTNFFTPTLTSLESKPRGARGPIHQQAPRPTGSSPSPFTFASGPPPSFDFNVPTTWSNSIATTPVKGTFLASAPSALNVVCDNTDKDSDRFEMKYSQGIEEDEKATPTTGTQNAEETVAQSVEEKAQNVGQSNTIGTTLMDRLDEQDEHLLQCLLAFNVEEDERLALEIEKQNLEEERLRNQR